MLWFIYLFTARFSINIEPAACENGGGHEMGRDECIWEMGDTILELGLW